MHWHMDSHAPAHACLYNLNIAVHATKVDRTRDEVRWEIFRKECFHAGQATMPVPWSGHFLENVLFRG
jgi:hypothetical protein